MPAKIGSQKPCMTRAKSLSGKEQGDPTVRNLACPTNEVNRSQHEETR
jgi:hypothetical protein